MAKLAVVKRSGKLVKYRLTQLQICINNLRVFTSAIIGMQNLMKTLIQRQYRMRQF